MKFNRIMAGVAAGFVQPGAGVGGDFSHSAMAADAGHAFFVVHDIPQAAGLWTGVTVITSVQGVGNYGCVLGMHGFGQVGNAGVPWRT